MNKSASSMKKNTHVNQKRNIKKSPRTVNLKKWAKSKITLFSGLLILHGRWNSYIKFNTRILYSYTKLSMWPPPLIYRAFKCNCTPSYSFLNWWSDARACYRVLLLRSSRKSTGVAHNLSFEWIHWKNHKW